MALQQRMHQQLCDGKNMPEDATNEKQQADILTKVARTRTILVILDDMWDSSHERPFLCIDTTTRSKLLVTTRIRGILRQGTEVELELLGLQESVELLAGCAELTEEIPPECLEIARLCGRLPLCLNIVGNLIRTFGVGWEEEVPKMLRTDMRSLTDDTARDGEQQPLNLQMRVIKSGLDSLSGSDAKVSSYHLDLKNIPLF